MQGNQSDPPEALPKTDRPAPTGSSPPRSARARNPSTPARRVAWEILLRVQTQNSYAGELLHGPLTEHLSPPDLALCTELVLGTLRWQRTLDFLAQQLARPRLTSLDPEVLVALRMGFYQLRFLSRMPAHAAVYETVELVKAAGKRSAAGLVNAVLRRGARADLASVRPSATDDWERWEIESSHPAWMLKRWMNQYGREAALALAQANNQPAGTDLRLCPARGTVAELEEEMRRQGVELAPGRFLPHSRRLVQGNVTRTEAYQRGEVQIQDEASQMVPYLLDVRAGHFVLDLCAAPGNKTAQLAEWAGSQGRVLACDLHLHRLRQAHAIPVAPNVHRVVLDGRQPLPFRVLFERILVDAPCSGTGTLRRNPEIKWRLTVSEVAELSAKQLQLLESAARALRPGGRLVYSTCSLEREENQEVVEAFLRGHPEFRLLPLREDAARLLPFLLPPGRRILEGDYLETSPTRDATDGFFAAILVSVLGQ